MTATTEDIFRVLKWPDDAETLHTKCAAVTKFDTILEAITDKMVRTMRAHNGIGLAAPQIGMLCNILVVEVEPGYPLVLVNPVLQDTSEELFQISEGCLSVPGYYENRKRPNKIVVRYQDVKGNVTETEFTGLVAFAIQHEIDHLHGKLFVDKASTMKKQRILAKMKKVASRRL